MFELLILGAYAQSVDLNILLHPLHRKTSKTGKNFKQTGCSTRMFFRVATKQLKTLENFQALSFTDPGLSLLLSRMIIF